MRRFVSFSIAGLVAMSAVTFAQAPNPFPANNATICGQYNGDWSQDTSTNPNTNRCTVTTNQNKAGSHPTQNWTIVVEQTVVYTKVGGTETVEDSGTTILACYNHRGNQISDPQDNPHCQPSN
ncbi:MAG: hypothetical protein Q8L86_19300 [Vicinamibacterales bacterium]|nr:hypothetical protein [Vicinamibacterales bacterium]